MVPLSKLPLLSTTTSASALLPKLGWHGLVLVRTPEVLAYVEASDLLERIQASTVDDWRPGDEEDTF
jgi:hypothetical protein